ncbi:MAG: DNA-binding protein [Candidatus Aminicenantes bacterium]|nr:DNA-binding protein [Candidatus Aminicenantes bacterium]
MRLFLDANVLFTAAHNPRGKAALVIELSRQGHWEISSSAYAIEEARRNLERKLPEFVRNLDVFSDVLQIAPHAVGLEFPHWLPTKDQPIFRAAVTCRATHLLTGDLNDFGAFMNQPEKTSGIRIQTVASFLDRL